MKNDRDELTGRETAPREVVGNGDEAAPLFGGQAWHLAGRVSLFLAFLVSVTSPILVFDTDLWYHLRHARHLFETGQLASDTSFSYLEPARPFTNYYWFFQVLALGVFQVGGYGGLIAFRSAIWLGFLVAVDRFLNGRSGGAGRTDFSKALAALVPALVAAVVLQRALNLRPHLLSYLCLLLLLLACERRRFPLWAVGVGWLWCNVHGVAFVVMWAILGAYGLDAFLEWRRGALEKPAAVRRLTLLGVTGGTVLLTPHGLSLLAVPFRSTEGASRIIKELLPFDPTSLLRFDVLSFSGPSAFALLLWLLAGLLVSRLGANPSSFAWRRLRPSRLLLPLAGVVLLAKADRLQVELTLLVLPLFADLLAGRASSSPSSPEGKSVDGRLVPAVAGTLLLLVSLSFLGRSADGLRLPHPLAEAPPAAGEAGAESRLPRGISAFLVEQGPGGKLMHPADYGGFFMWALGDRYRIHMDLELPFAFSAGDYFELQHAFYDAGALATLLRRDQPDFIAVDRRPSGFGERLGAVAPSFAPIFVDDVAVLWADAAKNPRLVAAWRFQALDAERALFDPAYVPSRDAREELLRLRSVAPDIRLPHRLLARLELAVSRESGQASSVASEHAVDLLRLAPEDPESHLLYGDALMSEGKLEEARFSFHEALELMPEAGRRPVHRRLAYVELAREQPRLAYEHLRQAVDIDVMRGSLRDLDLLARLADQLGEREHAEQLRAILALRGGA